MTQMPYKGQYKNPADEKKAIERTLAFNKAQRERGPGPNLGPANKTFKPFGGNKRFQETVKMSSVNTTTDKDMGIPSRKGAPLGGAKGLPRPQPKGLGSAVRNVVKGVAGPLTKAIAGRKQPRPQSTGLGSAVKRAASIAKPLAGAAKSVAGALNKPRGLGSAAKGLGSVGKSLSKVLGGAGRGGARVFQKGGMATTSKVGKAVKRKTADVKGRAMKGK